MADYDISGAFGRIEDELISSMIRNFDRHRAEETDYGFNWAQWQAEQLKALERYRRENRKKFGPEFQDLNIKIEQAIREMEKKGGADAEREILRQIQRGFTPPGDGTKGAFFRTNRRKLDALVKATTDDMSKAETAILRMANDKYRKAIFDAQVYANSGAGTYEKAVDMATKDMAAAGLNCVEYKNGARHRLEDYADMAIRTANKRAYLYGEGERRKAWGVTTVIVNKRTDACPQCLPFCGKVFIDDVWSGGSAADGDYPLISEAMAQGLYHPRCRDSHTTYFPGISTANDKWTSEELKAVKRREDREAQQQYAQRQADKWQRVADTRLDPENQSFAIAKANDWADRAHFIKPESFKDQTLELAKSITNKENVEYNPETIMLDGTEYKVDGVNVIISASDREKEVAALLSKWLGQKVTLGPKISGKIKNVSCPDYFVGDKWDKWDFKELKGNGKDAIRDAIKKKAEQASKFIIDISNYGRPIEDAIRQAKAVFGAFNTKFVNEIILINGNKVVGAYKKQSARDPSGS